MDIKIVEFIYSEDVSVINRLQFEAHMRLYKGYVDKYNEIREKLELNADRKNANATYSQFRGLKRGETFALNGVILHELYFENIGRENKKVDNKEEKDKKQNIHTMNFFQSDFSSYELWKEDFIATAKASRGWVILAYEQRTKKFINISLDAHDVGNILLSFPVLVLDMYEHAYFLEYGDKKEEYINAFIDDINWDAVSCRLSRIKP